MTATKHVSDKTLEEIQEMEVESPVAEVAANRSEKHQNLWGDHECNGPFESEEWEALSSS